MLGFFIPLLELNTYAEIVSKAGWHFDIYLNLSNQEGERNTYTKVAGATKCWNSCKNVRRCHVSRRTHYIVSPRAREREGSILKGRSPVGYFSKSRKPRSGAVSLTLSATNDNNSGDTTRLWLP